MVVGGGASSLKELNYSTHWLASPYIYYIQFYWSHEFVGLTPAVYLFRSKFKTDEYLVIINCEGCKAKTSRTFLSFLGQSKKIYYDQHIH